MARVPDQLVAGRVEHPVQGDGELGRAKARADVTPGLLDRVDGVIADLAAEPDQLVTVESTEIGRALDALEEGHPCVV